MNYFWQFYGTDCHTFDSSMAWTLPFLTVLWFEVLLSWQFYGVTYCASGSSLIRSSMLMLTVLLTVTYVDSTECYVYQRCPQCWLLRLLTVRTATSVNSAVGCRVCRQHGLLRLSTLSTVLTATSIDSADCHVCRQCWLTCLSTVLTVASVNSAVDCYVCRQYGLLRLSTAVHSVECFVYQQCWLLRLSTVLTTTSVNRTDRYVCQQCLFTAVSVDRTDSADGMITWLSRWYDPLARPMLQATDLVDGTNPLGRWPIDSADGMNLVDGTPMVRSIHLVDDQLTWPMVWTWSMVRPIHLVDGTTCRLSRWYDQSTNPMIGPMYVVDILSERVQHWHCWHSCLLCTASLTLTVFTCSANSVCTALTLRERVPCWHCVSWYVDWNNADIVGIYADTVGI